MVWKTYKIIKGYLINGTLVRLSTLTVLSCLYVYELPIVSRNVKKVCQGAAMEIMGGRRLVYLRWFAAI